MSGDAAEHTYTTTPTLWQFFVTLGTSLSLLTLLFLNGSGKLCEWPDKDCIPSVDVQVTFHKCYVLSKHFPIEGNASFEQVVYKLNLERNLLQSEADLLSSKIAKQRIVRYVNPATGTNRTLNALDAGSESQKHLLILRAVRKLFMNLHGLTNGATRTLLSGTTNNSKYSAFDFRHRQEESAAVNRLLVRKVAEIADTHSRWREEMAVDVAEEMHSRLHRIQNPEDCNKAKKLVCDINREACGLGCQLHYGITCLAASFALNRTTILRVGRWTYTSNHWEDYFVPPSPKCQWTPISNQLTVWRNSSHDAENTVLYPLDIFALQYYKPYSVEKSFAEKVSYFHGRPWIWWIGQLLVTLFRVQPDFEELYRKKMKILGFKTPIVGIHVRRSDKVSSEARPYDLEKYMTFVEDYFDKLEAVQRVDQRRVYLASDDPYVYLEFRMKYPHYALIHNQAAAKSSARKTTRRSEDSLRGIMVDMYFLSQTDHLVCTMSSNVCRIVYGLLQSRFADASRKYDSLDLDYIYVGSNPHYHKAVHPSNPNDGTSLNFVVGDRIEIKKTFWNGTSSGLLVRGLDNRGSFPAYKFIDDIEVY